MKYAGALATIEIGTTVDIENELVIIGSNGRVTIPNDWWNTGYFEANISGKEFLKRYSFNFEGNGFRYLLQELMIFAVKPGDGSAREQAASCQKVLGGWANIANEYATKRYRSNLINWGMLPFLIKEGELPFANGDYLFFPQIRKAVEEKDDVIRGYVVGAEGLKEFEVALGELTDDEREIILKGCLINYNRK